MSVTIDRTTSGKCAPSLPVRLSLTPAPGGLDGTWWPRSRALTRELPLLTAALGDLWGRITRVTVNPAYWPVIPRRVSVAGRTVHVGWSTEEQDPHRLTFFSTDGCRDVLVIPPETGADAAAQLMAGDGIDTPARAEAADRIDARIREERWETDDGAGRSVVPAAASASRTEVNLRKDCLCRINPFGVPWEAGRRTLTCNDPEGRLRRVYAGAVACFRDRALQRSARASVVRSTVT
ncbi:DUF5994 family protein [Streptomyces sp. NPDC001410]|uniref:DUF5994 family protein n=1 Tax=Streptomyces sp. NPDC001410 TaxID=3364574 RepID=UPI0036B4A589